MVILYQTAKFRSAITIAIVILGPTGKLNSHQYFQLYSMAARVQHTTQWDNLSEH